MRGRADGYDPARNRRKRSRPFAATERQPANHRQLHWAQAKIYGWLLCQTRGLDELELALVYFDVTSHKETLFVERHTAAQLRVFFETQCQAFIDWAAQEMAHRAARDRALSALRFPHDDFRTSQRQLAEAVYKAACTGTTLMAQAPTGIGKTLGTLFPQLKAFPGSGWTSCSFSPPRRPVDARHWMRCRRCNATPTMDCGYWSWWRAKRPANTGQGLSWRILPAGPRLLRPPARGAAAALGSPCSTVRPCAKWRLPIRSVPITSVRRWHAGRTWWSVTTTITSIAAPSSTAALANDWRICLLVDEAHNLIDRARGMYSAELDQRAFVGLASRASTLEAATGARAALLERAASRAAGGLPVQPELPLKLLGALQQAVSAITDYLGEQPAGLDAELQRAYFDAMHFCRVAELFGEHSLFDISLLPATARSKARRSILCVRNVVPAPFWLPARRRRVPVCCSPPR